MPQIKPKIKYEETDEVSIDLIRVTRQTIENKQCPATEDGSGHICGYNFVFRFHGNRTLEAFISDKNAAAMGEAGAIRAAYHIAIDKALDSMDFTFKPVGVGKNGLLNFKVIEDPRK
jgi:hypothetical protein